MSFSFAGMTPEDLAALPTTVFGNLSAAKLSQLDAAQAAALSSAQIAAIYARAFSGFTRAAMRGLSASALTTISPNTAALFSATQIAAIAPAALAAMPVANLAAMRAGEASGLSAAEIEALSPAEIAALRPGAFAALSRKAIHAISASQAAALTPSQVEAFGGKQLNHLAAAALNAAPLSNLSRAQIAALSAAAIGRFSTSEFGVVLGAHLAWLTAAQAVGLTIDQIASLSGAEAAAIRASPIAALSAAQFDALSLPAISALLPKQLAGLGSAAVNGLTPAQLDDLDAPGLSPSAISGLAAKTLDAFPSSQFAKFTAGQVGALGASEIAHLDLADLDALNPLYFGAVQVAGLPADYISGISLSTFDKAVAPYVADLTTSAAQALSVAEIDSLTSAEIASISTAQFDAMDQDQQQAVLGRSALVQQAESLEVDGTLGYSGILQVLQTAARGGVNAVVFAELQALASDLNAVGGIATSNYVAEITRDVVDGNTANAYWNGGASTATALGDLSANSSLAQMDDLIGKWFLGTDLPSLSLPSAAGQTYADQYEAETLPLFGASGPSYLDINQGDVGDCYFLAALGETAYLDPSSIENMIGENANGTYSVRFVVDGQDDWVTVNDELPVMTTQQAADGSTMQFDNSSYLWSPLIEKAYAQLMEQTDVTPGSTLGINDDSYAATSGGGGNGISAITGQDTSWVGLVSGESASDLASVANTLENALSGRLDVLFGTSSLDDGIGNLVDDHMFDVLQVNVAAQTVLLQNPWNLDVAGSGKPAQFTETLSQLSMDSDGYGDPAGFYVATKA